VVDLIGQRAIVYEDDEQTMTGIPSELQIEARRRREQLIEQLADVNDEVAERYLEGEELPPELLHAALRQATLAGQVVPFLCGTALRNRGVQPLLDAIVAYLPSPLDVLAIKGQDPVSGAEVICQADESEPLAALVFKINTDPFVGRLAYLRVYSGTLRRGQSVINVNRGEKVRIGRLVRMFADRREEVEEIGGYQAPVQGRPGQNVIGLASAGRRRPHLSGETGQPDQGDGHLRHGGTPSGGAGGTHETRVQGGGGGGRAAGGLL